MPEKVIFISNKILAQEAEYGIYLPRNQVKNLLKKATVPLGKSLFLFVKDALFRCIAMVKDDCC